MGKWRERKGAIGKVRFCSLGDAMSQVRTQVRRLLDYFVVARMARIETDELAVLGADIEQIKCCHFSFESR